LSDRPNWDGRGEPWKYYLTTAIFSLAADPPLVLGPYIVIDEWPDLAAKHKPRWDGQMSETWQMMKEHRFVAAWQRRKPWTDAAFPQVAQSLSEQQKSW